MKFRVGTRDSALAIIQTEMVCEALIAKNPELKREDFEFIKIKTQGDKILHKNLADIGGKNLFVKEIQEALLNNLIDFAVHSLKDITAKQNPDILIAACLEREDPRDALVSFKYKSIDELPEAGLIGTSSVRRKSLALGYRSDLLVAPFRGNVQTRLEKLKNNHVDATFLAVAGLKRLNIDKNIYVELDTNYFLPAISQGVIGVECLADNIMLTQLLKTINHEETSICNQAERGFLESLDADCNSPIAAYSFLKENMLHLEALVISSNGVSHKQKIICDMTEGWSAGYALGLSLKKYL